MSLIIAHRGGADLWPENTLPAFEGAMRAGADGAELDVHITRDGEVVVYHDEALKPEITRGPDGAWLPATGPLLKDLSLSELQAYDVGRLNRDTDYGRRHPNQIPSDGARIPRLADVIALAQTTSATFQLWIELKTDLLCPERGADPVELAEAAVDLVQGTGFADRTVFVSFDWRSLAAAKAKAPHIPIFATTLPWAWFAGEMGQGPGWNDPDIPAYRRGVRDGARWLNGLRAHDWGGWPRTVRELGADGWFPHFSDATPQHYEEARRLGLKTAAWTVPVTRISDLTDLGIFAICTDSPTKSE